MNEELSADPSPVAKPEREAVEGRLDLRNQHHAGSRYRLLNLRDCGAKKTSEIEKADEVE